MPETFVNVDYGITQKSCLGIVVAYQEMQAYASGFTDKTTRLNISMRYLRNVRIDNNMVFYYGLHAGITMWNYYTVWESPAPSTNNNTLSNNFSGQIFCGWRFYYCSFLAIHGEIGIGAPYLAEAGLSVIL